MPEHTARGPSAPIPVGSAVTASQLGLEPNAWYDPAYREAYKSYVILAEAENRICVILVGKKYGMLLSALQKRSENDVKIMVADDRRRDIIVALLSPAMRFQVVQWGFKVETFDPQKHK